MKYVQTLKILKVYLHILPPKRNIYYRGVNNFEFFKNYFRVFEIGIHFYINLPLVLLLYFMCNMHY